MVGRWVGSGVWVRRARVCEGPGPSGAVYDDDNYAGPESIDPLGSAWLDASCVSKATPSRCSNRRVATTEEMGKTQL